MRHRCARLLVLVALIQHAGRAYAAESLAEEFPVREIDRPSTVLYGFMHLEAAGTLQRLGSTRTATAVVTGGLGLGRGFEAGIGIPAVQAFPSFALENPAIYLWFSTDLSTRWSVFPKVEAFVPIFQVAIIDAGSEIALRLSNSTELIAEPTYSITLGPELNNALLLPVSLKIQALDRFYIQPAVGLSAGRSPSLFRTTGVRNPFLFDKAGVLVGVETVLTFGEMPGPLADLLISWQWPSLLVLAGSHQETGPTQWEGILSIRVFLAP